MKVLCFIDSLCAGGAQRQLIEIALGLKEIGADVSFLVYHSIPFNNHILESNSIPVVLIEEPNYLKRLIKIRKYIRRSQSDVVLSFLGASNFISEISGFPTSKWKIICSERSDKNPSNISIRERIFHIAHRLSSDIVVNSNNTKSGLLNLWPRLPKERIKVIYNAVNLEKWKPSLDYKPLKNKKLNITIPANHHPNKNCSGLLESLTLLPPEILKILSIRWYGDQRDHEFTKSLITRQKYNLQETIEFLPPSIGILNIIQQADIVAIFSHFEGFPNAVCEGMACAKPVICTRVSDIPEILDHTPKLLCDHDNPVSIAESIKFAARLNSEELQIIGKRNRSIAEEIFRYDTIISEYLNLFHS